MKFATLEALAEIERGLSSVSNAPYGLCDRGKTESASTRNYPNLSVEQKENKAEHVESHKKMRKHTPSTLLNSRSSKPLRK